MFGSILNKSWILNMKWFLIGQGYTRLWIKFTIIDIWQVSENAWSSQYTSVTQGSVKNSPSYMFGRLLNIPWALNMLGLEDTRVVNMLRLHIILRKLYFKDFNILNVLSSEHAHFPKIHRSALRNITVDLLFLRRLWRQSVTKIIR